MTLNQLHPKPSVYQRTIAVLSRKTPMPQAPNAGTSSLTPSRRAAGVPTLAVRSRNNIMG